VTEPLRRPRAERRAATQGRILAAARRTFAERGFERTTIRAVAALARVDPALVMQHFGSKQELFAAAIRPDPEELANGDRAEVVELLLTSLGMKLGDLPEPSLAMMRSMLSHPEVAATARARMEEQAERLTGGIAAGDARLRATLAVATMLGVTIGRQLLALSALRDAPPDQIADLLRPCLRTLVPGSAEGSTRYGSSDTNSSSEIGSDRHTGWHEHHH
jgi:AcrR family transcriptional regulator